VNTTPMFKVHDEDWQVCGEIRLVQTKQLGWMYRAWAVNENADATKLGLHNAPAGAEAEIRRYWGMT